MEQSGWDKWFSLRRLLCKRKVSSGHRGRKRPIDLSSSPKQLF
jgi:hypothetical protein